MPEIDDVVRDVLDDVLADTPRMTDESFADARARVLQMQGRRKPRRWMRLAAGAAAVALIATAALIISMLVDPTPQPASAATVLQEAATLIQASDPALTPGQFRYVRTETTMRSGTERCAYTQRDIDEIWTPSDPEAEWLLRRDYGRIAWDTCQDPTSTTLPRAYQQEYRAKHGLFAVPGAEQPGSPPSWYNPTPEFLAGLPRDPAAMFELIKQEYKSGTAEPGKAYFQHATQLLSTSVLPADLRATMYRAMTFIPGVTVTEQFATIDGRKGTAIGLDMGTRGDIRTDIVIDPRTGVLIGERTLGPRGELHGTTVITHGIAEKIGTAPVR
jgi:hypothetical protein